MEASSEWEFIKGYESLYCINKRGEVKSNHKRNFGKLLRPKKNRAGYHTVTLSKPGEKPKTKLVHRLVAETFILRSAQREYVNHIDGNKLNNVVSNLCWVSHAENILHAYSTGLIKKITKEVVDSCTGQIFSSAKQVAQLFDIKYSTLRSYLNGGIKYNPTCFRYAVA